MLLFVLPMPLAVLFLMSVRVSCARGVLSNVVETQRAKAVGGCKLVLRVALAVARHDAFATLGE